ncbi:MAG: hypothetical protein SGJ11_05345 [Phycisphaerae bacterium]|nr:hypothetical protein [Phycisphaerae bacterium]
MSFSRLMTVRSFRRAAAAFTVAVSLLAPASTASAQFGGSAGFEEAMVPDFLSRDISLFVDSLGLEAWQRPILESLLSDYKLSFDAGLDAMREKMTKVKDNLSSGADPDTIMKQILQPLETWGDEKKRLKEEFLDNVKSQLTDQQVERWPKFERAIRREKSIDRGELQGETIDMILIIRELQFAPPVMQGLEPAIEEYETRLDEALAARQRKIDQEQPKIKDAMAVNDQRAGVASMESIMSARVAVRDVQDQHRPALTEAILKVAGPEQSAKFKKAALERAYPKVYRTDPILPLFDAARAAEGITAEQTAALDALQVQYVVEIAEVNGRLTDAYRADEPREPRRRVDLMIARAEGSDAAKQLRSEPAATAAARKARDETHDKYRKAILAILSEEQQKTMPNFGKGERIRPDDAERMRDLKESGARSRDGTSTPLGAGAPAGRGAKKPRGESPDRVRSAPADQRRDTGAAGSGGRAAPQRQE